MKTTLRSTNTSGFRGVTTNKYIKKNGSISLYWTASIGVARKVIRLGTWEYTEEGKVEAAKAYDAAIEQYGVKRVPNFSTEGA